MHCHGNAVVRALFHRATGIGIGIQECPMHSNATPWTAASIYKCYCGVVEFGRSRLLKSKPNILSAMLAAAETRQTWG